MFGTVPQRLGGVFFRRFVFFSVFLLCLLFGLLDLVLYVFLCFGVVLLVMLVWSFGDFMFVHFFWVLFEGRV